MASVLNSTLIFCVCVCVHMLLPAISFHAQSGGVFVCMYIRILCVYVCVCVCMRTQTSHSNLGQ